MNIFSNIVFHLTDYTTIQTLMQNQLNAAATVAHDGITITEWKAKNIYQRISFAFNFARKGSLFVVERGITSDKSVFIKDPLSIHP